MESIPCGWTGRFVKHCRQNGNSFLKRQPGKTWQTCLCSSSFEAPFAWWTQSVTNSLHKRFSLHPTTTCQNKLTKADVGGNLICLHLHISSGKMVNANFFEVDMFVGVFPRGSACSTWQTKHIDQSIWRHQPYAPQQIFISQTSWERLFWIIWLCTKYHKGLLSNRVHW